jgi:hypothetical protein
MGTLLTTLRLAVPIIAWMSGTLFLDVQQLRLARVSFAPREIFPNSRKSSYYAAAAQANSNPAAARWAR